MIRFLLAAILVSPLAAAELPAAFESAGKTVPRMTSSGARVSRRPLGAPAVRASWREGAYNGPPRRYDCIPALNAVVAALDAVEAKSGARGCSGSRGVFASWSALTPAEDGGVEAVWGRAQLQYTLSDPRGCSAFAETLEHMLDVLPVRNVNVSVFCQPGNSFISAGFDYLAVP